MVKINVDFDKIIGKIKPMHGVGQPPFRWPLESEFFPYLTEANIPYSRLHDVGGAYGGNIFVDIPNIFRDFSKDEYAPESYDFAFTDWLISDLIKAGCEPIYRLGVTIENYQAVRAYRLDPPTDFAKWARICEHIIRHYTQGWANGFLYDIKYWEIWNEPDNEVLIKDNQMWHGTKEQFYELYTVVSKHLKGCFGDSIKVGGYGSCGFYAWTTEKKQVKEANSSSRIDYFVDFFHEFMSYIKENNAPLDFFSWHSYASIEDTAKMADRLADELCQYGYAGVETHINEWNTAPGIEKHGTSYASCSAAGFMIAQQYTKTNLMCFYDARVAISSYAGFFNPLTLKPFCTYYSFKAFGELYRLGKQVKCEIEGNTKGIYALAATNSTSQAFLIANLGEANKVTTNICEGFKAYVIDENNLMTEKPLDSQEFEISQNQVILFCRA